MEECGTLGETNKHDLKEFVTWGSALFLLSPSFFFIFYMTSWTVPLKNSIAWTLFSSHLFILQNYPCHRSLFCRSFKQLLSCFSFLALSLSNYLSFSASCPLFFQLSFFSPGFKPPLLIVVFIFCQPLFVLDRIACSLHTRSHFQDACKYFPSCIETHSDPLLKV